jgi:hypothetical protein
MKPLSLLRFLPVLLGLAALHGCVDIILGRETIRGSGTTAEDTYTFTDLTGVQLSTLGELDIHLGDREELRIETDDNLLPYFEAEQVGDILRIRGRRGVRLRPSEPVRYTLTVRSLERIALSSSGNARAPTLSADRFEVDISSSGDLSMEGIDAGVLQIGISSSGNVTIHDGAVAEQDIRISSSGDYDGESVRSGHATARLSSSGNARLWVEESLEARLSSSGSLYYAGAPEVSDNRSSSGRVERIR